MLSKMIASINISSLMLRSVSVHLLFLEENDSIHEYDFFNFYSEFFPPLQGIEQCLFFLTVHTVSQKIISFEFKSLLSVGIRYIIIGSKMLIPSF